MSYEEAVSALRRQLSNISDSIVEKDKLIVQLNEAYRHEEKVAIYAIYASSTIVLWRSCYYTLETILRNIGANTYSMHGYMIAGEEISAQVRRAAQAIRSRSALLRW